MTIGARYALGVSNTPPELMTITEFAAATRRSELTCRRAVARGEVAVVKLGNRIMVPRSEVERLVADARVADASTMDVRPAGRR